MTSSLTSCFLAFTDSVYRKCLANGTWALKGNYSQCRAILNTQVTQTHQHCQTPAQTPHMSPRDTNNEPYYILTWGNCATQPNLPSSIRCSLCATQATCCRGTLEISTLKPQRRKQGERCHKDTKQYMLGGGSSHPFCQGKSDF